MEELSLYILDITMNSVRAGASEITIDIDEDADWLDLKITDNGCGMTEEQVSRLSDPFFTTRTTRKVGLGVPFLKMLAEMTDGYVKVTSVHESVSEEHGTTIEARFGKNHIDFIPVGDIADTVVVLIQGSPDVNFTFTHRTAEGTVSLSCSELREILGDISLGEPEILTWIKDNLREQYADIHY